MWCLVDQCLCISACQKYIYNWIRSIKVLHTLNIKLDDKIKIHDLGTNRHLVLNTVLEVLPTEISEEKEIKGI